MFPGGQKRERESEKDCLRREIKEELPELKLGRIRLWKEVNGTNRHSGRKMSDAIFIVNKVSGDLTIGDKQEIDKATWRQPRGTRLTPTSRYQGHALPQAIAPPRVIGLALYYYFALSKAVKCLWETCRNYVVLP